MHMIDCCAMQFKGIEIRGIGHWIYVFTKKKTKKQDHNLVGLRFESLAGIVAVAWKMHGRYGSSVRFSRTIKSSQINLKLSRIKTPPRNRLNFLVAFATLAADAVAASLFTPRHEDIHNHFIRSFRPTGTLFSSSSYRHKLYYFLVSIKSVQCLCESWPICSFPCRAKHNIQQHTARHGTARHKSIENDHLAMKSAAWTAIFVFESNVPNMPLAHNHRLSVWYTVFDCAVRAKLKSKKERKKTLICSRAVACGWWNGILSGRM